MATTSALERPHRHTALRLAYLYTLVGAGAFGLWVLLAPHQFVAAFAISMADPYLLGILGAIYTAFGVAAVLGVRAPEKFAPVLLFQLVYKSLWLAIVFAPHAVHGGVPDSAWLIAAVFASYVILDVIALPFSSLLAGRD